MKMLLLSKYLYADVLSTLRGKIKDKFGGDGSPLTISALHYVR